MCNTDPMNTISNFITNTDDAASKLIDSMLEVLPEDIGLDRRTAYRLYICEDGLAVHKKEDKNLQYYGGFEYIDKEFRREYGDWVIYTLGDSDERVEDCLKKFYEEEIDHLTKKN